MRSRGPRRRCRRSSTLRAVLIVASFVVGGAWSSTADADATVVRIDIRDRRLYFQQPVPSSQTFDLEVVSEHSRYSSGFVEIWPKAMARCTPTPPDEEHQKQHHFVALLPVADAALPSTTSVLRGTVPPLQVGEEFCFKVRREAGLSGDDVIVVANDLGRTLLREAYEPTNGGDLVPAIKATLAASIQRRFDEPIDASAALSPAADAVAQAVRQAPEFRNLREAWSNLQGTQQDLDTASAKLKILAAAAADVLRRQSPGGLPAASLPLGDPVRFVDAARLFDVLQNVAQARDELEALRQKASPNDRATFAVWIDALTRYLAIMSASKPGDPPTAEALKVRREARPPLPLTGRFLYWDADLRTFVGADEIAKKNVAVNHGALLAQLQAYRVVAGADTRTADDWIAAIEPLRLATKGAQDAVQDLATRRAAFEAARASAALAFPTLARTVLSQQDLEVSLRDVSVSDVVGEHQLKASATMIAIDAGLVVAVPTGGKSETVWLVPTLGLNVYLFVPVERSVPLDELVGNWFLQRFSVTFGFTLVTPSVPGRTTSGDVFGQYLVVGGGLRLSQYTRFVGGSVLYTVTDPNPGSIETKRYGAPYAGFSADFDLVKVLVGGASALIGK